MSKNVGTQQAQEEPKLVAIIRIRGRPTMNRKIGDTLKMLRLHHVNHAAIYQFTPTIRGMLEKVKDYVSYGPLSEVLLERLLTKRARVIGDKFLTSEYLKEHTEYPDIKSLTKALYSGKVKYSELKGIKPMFRLHPPKGGHRHGTIKRPYTTGGSLGKVPVEFMDKLLMKMI